MAAPATDRALDITELLATRKTEVEQAYESQKDQRNQAEQQSIGITQEMFRLEGEHRCLEGLAKALEGKK